MTAAAKLVLKWWLILAFAVGLALSAIGEFGQLDKRVTTLESLMKSHVEMGDKIDQQQREDLQYIRERVDRLIELQQTHDKRDVK